MLLGNHVEVPPIECENVAAGSLPASNHTGVSRSKREIGVPGDQMPNSSEIILAAFERQGAGFEVAQERVKHPIPEPVLNQIGDLGQDACRHQKGPRVGLKHSLHPAVVGIAAVQERE